MPKKILPHIILLGALWLCLLSGSLLGCITDQALHIRRLVGWSPTQHTRLEVDLISAPDAPPSLQLRLWKRQTLLHQHTHQAPQVQQLANAYIQRQKDVERQLYTLSTQLFVTHIQPKLSKPPKAWHPVSPTKDIPLRQFQQTLQLRHDVRVTLRYQEKYTSGVRAVLLLQTLDKRAKRVIKHTIPSPQRARIRALSCRQKRCFVHIEHDNQRPGSPRSTYSFFFSLHKEAARLWNTHGYRLHDKKQFAKAAHSFEIATKLDPSYGDGFYNLACTFALRGKTQQALATLKRAIKRDKSFRTLACKDKDFRSLYKTTFFLRTLNCQRKKKKPITRVRKP